MMEGNEKYALDKIRNRIAECLGLDFPDERLPDLVRGLEAAAKELGFGRPEYLDQWLVGDTLTARQVEILAHHLTVGETYFFRDPAGFQILEREILPALIAERADKGRIIRIWSAGCCTGEEAYSIAFACARALPDFREWNVSIFATDINTVFLSKAEAGIYSEWSFRGAPGGLSDRFFSPVPDRCFAVNQTIKNLVRFGYLNLVEDVYPSLYNHTNAMDVIFCRNVLMYFTPDQRSLIVSRLHRCLIDGGYLLVSPVEATVSLFPMFTPEEIDGFTFFRKDTHQPFSGAIVEPIKSETEASIRPFEPTAKPASVEVPLSAARGLDYLEVARVSADQGRLEEALAACHEAIAADRTDTSAHFLCAMICDEIGKVEEAISELGKVLYLDQDSVLAHHALGGLYRRTGKLRESRRHLELALALLTGRNEEIVPAADGMSRGYLAESIRVMLGESVNANA